MHDLGPECDFSRHVESRPRSLQYVQSDNMQHLPLQSENGHAKPIVAGADCSPAKTGGNRN
jgi:hypothetical protein